MTKEHKIIKYNLEDEVQQLKEGGLSYFEIASTIKRNHPMIEDLKGLSPMAIQRYLSSKDEREIQRQLDSGKDPVEDFVDEYRKAIKDIDVKTKELYEYSLKLLNSISESDDDIMKLKAVKEVRDNLDLIRKNQVSLIQFSEKKTNTICNVNLKKEIHVRNLLMNFNKELCSKCRLKIAELLEEDEEI